MKFAIFIVFVKHALCFLVLPSVCMQTKQGGKHEILRLHVIIHSVDASGVEKSEYRGGKQQENVERADFNFYKGRL